MAMNAVRVGIDIEQASMVGAQIRTGRQGHTLMAVSARALPDGLMFEGEVVDVEGLAAELKTFWKAAGFAGKRFSVGIANQRIVVRTMEFPIIDPKELRAAIEFQAQEAIPIPLDEAILDFQVLSTTPGEGEGGGRQQVLIVAAQRDMIDQFMQVARKAGLDRSTGIDLQAFALMRSVAPPVAFVDQGAPQADGASALINIGAGISNIVVASGGVPQSSARRGTWATRRSSRPSWTIAASAVRRPTPAAHRRPQRAPPRRRPTSRRPRWARSTRSSTPPASRSPTRSAVRSTTTTRFSRTRPSLVSSISGEGALTRNMCDYLAGACDLSVALGNPLQFIAENKSKLPQPELELIAPRLAIALGLAFEDEE